MCSRNNACTQRGSNNTCTQRGSNNASTQRGGNTRVPNAAVKNKACSNGQILLTISDKV